MLRNKIILLIMIFSALPLRAMQGSPRLTGVSGDALVKTQFALPNGLIVHRKTNLNEITYTIPCADRSEVIISAGPLHGDYKGSVVYMSTSGKKGPAVISLINAEAEFKFLQKEYIRYVVLKQGLDHIRSK